MTMYKCCTYLTVTKVIIPGGYGFYRQFIKVIVSFMKRVSVAKEKKTCIYIRS